MTSTHPSDPIAFTAVTGWRAYYIREDGSLMWNPIVGVEINGYGGLHFVDTDAAGQIEPVTDIDNLAFVTHESQAAEKEAQWHEERDKETS